MHEPGMDRGPHRVRDPESTTSPAMTARTAAAPAPSTTSRRPATGDADLLARLGAAARRVERLRDHGVGRLLCGPAERPCHQRLRQPRSRTGRQRRPGRRRPASSACSSTPATSPSEPCASARAPLAPTSLTTLTEISPGPCTDTAPERPGAAPAGGRSHDLRPPSVATGARHGPGPYWDHGPAAGWVWPPTVPMPSTPGLRESDGDKVNQTRRSRRAHCVGNGSGNGRGGGRPNDHNQL